MASSALDFQILSPRRRQRMARSVVAEFARSLVVDQGLPPAQALAVAERECARALALASANPAPLSGPYGIVSRSGVLYGRLWLAVRDDPAPETRHILFLDTLPRFRRQGVATRALRRLDSLASQIGAPALTLHVFPSNRPALVLYNRCGFEPWSGGWIKWLAPPSGGPGRESG
jgi:GNAT superfamily N-acetyltransferase